MTVIASFAIENHPFMISDSLISVKLNHRNRLFQRLPAPIQKFNLGLPKDAKYTITNVHQKTVKICDRFIMSCAGVVSEAEFLVNHFRSLTQKSPPSGAMFDREIAALANQGKVGRDFSALALIEESGRIYSGSFNVLYFRNRKFNFMKAGGSGAKDLLDVFAAYRGKQTNRLLNPHEEGLGLSLGLSSVLLGKEIVTREPLERAYGGFYEISYWNNADFEKLNNVLHLHWVLHYQPPKGIGFDPPIRIQKLEYHNSVMYLRNIELANQKKTDDTVYIVSESGHPKGQRPPEIKPNLSYKWIVNHLYIVLPDSKVRYKNYVQYLHDDNYRLLLEENHTELQLQFATDYFDFMKDIIADLDLGQI